MQNNNDIEILARLKQVILEKNGLLDWQHSHEGTHKNEREHRDQLINSIVDGKLKVFAVQNEHFNEKMGDIVKAIEGLTENVKETNKGFAEYKTYINNRYDEVAEIAQSAVKKAGWHSQLKQYGTAILITTAFICVMIFAPVENIKAFKQAAEAVNDPTNP